MDIQVAMIRGQRWAVEALEIFCMKLVKKIGNFLREVAQLAKLAEAHLVGAYHLLPPQHTPTYVVTPTTKQLGDFTSSLCTGPDIATDAEAEAPVRIVALPAQILPPPIRSQRSFHCAAQFTCLILPVVLFEALVPVIYSRCASNVENEYYYSLWCINAYYYFCAPWMALPIRRAVSFRRACVMSVPRAESR